MDSGEAEDDSRPWGDQLRELSATVARTVDEYDQRVRELHAMDAPLTEQLRADVYRMRTFQLINSEVARAYDAMVAAGGEGNQEAYANYREAVELASALLPLAGSGPDLGT